MARRGKTKVSGRGNMKEATAAKARQSETSARATEQAERRGAQTQSEIVRTGAQAGQMIQRAQEGEKDREARGAQAEAQLADRQAGRQQQQSQFESAQAQSAQQATERTDVQAAGQGLERNPEFARREAELQAEIERGERQAIKPGELEGGRFIPTEDAESEKRTETYQEAYGLETKRMQVEAQRAATMQRASTALRKGDDEAYKIEKDRYAKNGERTAAHADKIIAAGMGDGTISQDDISYVKRLAKNNPNPELQREVESGELGPHSARFLRGKIISDGLEFVSQTGDWPDMDLIDVAHPVYAQFQQHVMEASQELQRRQQYGAFMGIKSLRDANRMKNKAAAVAMMALERAKMSSRAMGGGGSQPLPSSPQPGGQQNAGAQPGAGPSVTPVDRPEQPDLVGPPSATLGR